MKPSRTPRSAQGQSGRGHSKPGRGNAKPGNKSSSGPTGPSGRGHSKSGRDAKPASSDAKPGHSGRSKSGLKRKTDNFNKFFNKKRNSAVKEALRQEKKAAKKERKEGIERHFEQRRLSRDQQAPDQRPRDHQAHSQQPRDQQPRGATSGHSQLPLNKYISNGGICSRRDAAELIRQGKVTVNGKLVTEPGTKVNPTDLVKVGVKKVTISNNFVYILLNKPKDYITTTDDPEGRKTVLDLIRPATTERVYPIGRLDRNTSGVLLLTNDGDLAQKLAHPSHQIKKIYHVTLDKALSKADFDKIAAGTVVLEDGPAPVDALAYADPKDRAQIGLEIHSGRNRIVRRIFEQLGYDVRGLDRVMYAGLTKKNVQRGHWRLLSEKEVRILKYLNSSIKGSPGRAKDLAPDALDVPENEEIEKKVRILRTEQPAKQIVPVKRAGHPEHPERRPISIERRDRRPERPAGRRPERPERPADRRPIDRRPERPTDRRPVRSERPAPRPPAKGIRPKTRRPGKPRKPSGPRPPSGPPQPKNED